MRRLSASAQTLNRKFKKEQRGIVIGNNLATLSDVFWQSFSCCSKTALFIYVLCVCVCLPVAVPESHVSCCHVLEDNFAFDFSLCSDARL